MNPALIAFASAHALDAALGLYAAGAIVVFVFGGLRASFAIALIASLASAALIGWAGVAGASGSEAGLDGIAVVAAPLLGLAAVAAVAAGGARFKDECGAEAAPFAFALLLVIALGWIGAARASNLLVVAAATEAAWLAQIGLVALAARASRSALNGAFRMLRLGGVGAALILLGAGLLARSAGALELGALGARGLDGAGARGAALVIAGLAVKAGIAPLHAWVGAGYGGAGSAGALTLGALGAFGALAVIVRLAVSLEPAPGVSLALLALGAASAVIGSVQAIGARRLERMIGYAIAAQAGCILMSASLGSRAGTEAALLSMAGLALAVIGVLGGACVAGCGGPLARLDGLARRAPLACVAMGAGALSLMGAPLTIGFVARWRLLEAGSGAGDYATVAVSVVSAIAGAYYGGRILERALFRRAEQARAVGPSWRALALAPALIAAIAIVAAGFDYRLTAPMTREAQALPARGAE